MRLTRNRCMPRPPSPVPQDDGLLDLPESRRTTLKRCSSMRASRHTSGTGRPATRRCAGSWRVVMATRSSISSPRSKEPTTGRDGRSGCRSRATCTACPSCWLGRPQCARPRDHVRSPSRHGRHLRLEKRCDGGPATLSARTARSCLGQEVLPSTRSGFRKSAGRRVSVSLLIASAPWWAQSQNSAPDFRELLYQGLFVDVYGCTGGRPG